MVTIEWQVKAAGRSPGQKETVERTPFVEALIKQGRVLVLEEDKPKYKPLKKSELAVGEPGTEGLVVPADVVVESDEASDSE
jgi:hypothetical protein